jgi:RNA polymerase-binding transcription factor DksA
MAKKVKANSAKKAAPAKKSGAAKKAAPKAKAKPAAKKPAAKKPVAKSAPKKAAPKAAAKKPAPKAAATKKTVTAKAPVKKVATVTPVKVATSKPFAFTKPNPIAHKAKPGPVDNRTRYSDAELKEFKGLIVYKLDEASRDYELLKNTLSHKDDHGTDDTSPTFKLLEDGSDVLSKEETAHLAARQEKYIQNLKNALIRIENKTYGICRVTGKLIPKERLRSVPHATLSIDAKLGQNR